MSRDGVAARWGGGGPRPSGHPVFDEGAALAGRYRAFIAGAPGETRPSFGTPVDGGNTGLEKRRRGTGKTGEYIAETVPIDPSGPNVSRML